ncbi:MAG: rRNA maturation RNase YbeY [Flavobacteriaceae bacterium]|nr:rRNA maturation RNase YbeY [Flavobacteriaceae bacterium]
MHKINVIIIFNNLPDYIPPEEVRPVMESYVSTYGFSIDRLVFNFISKDRLLELNQKYLNHDTDTDIITFDYSKNKTLSAEIFISLWAVGLSAQEERQSIENETLRVLVHGILHCLGKKDASNGQKSEMRGLEDDFIKMFHVKQNSHV